MRGILGTALAANLLLAQAAAIPARAADPRPDDGRTVVEALIAGENPCKQLQTRQFGMTLGVEKLKDVHLDSATIRLDGNQVSLDFSGRLACETSPGAAFTGDAAATVVASAGLSLADCSIDALDVALSDFGGTFGPILAALAPTIEAEIRKTAAPKIRDACRDFRGRG